MGLTKSENFSVTQNDLAELFKALGHPARVAILEHLIQSNTCITGDIVEHLPLSQATVSQHLKALKNTGLIKGTIEGTSVCYCIDEVAWAEAKSKLGGFFDQFDPHSTCC
ncbi:winged helix-turn-helix transcriptional regulator [bacterium SCSIO 12741]|nr:winged helix-turn-helix transcriptional regulator [bacterium SCSIO 12741]